MGLFGALTKSITKGGGGMADTSKPLHTHSKKTGDSSQAKYDASRPDEIPPIPAPKPDAVMNNRFANDKIQAMGSEWFQGEEMVAQRNAIKEMRSQPSNLPPTETQSTGDYGDPFMQPLNQNDPGFEHMRYYKSAKTDDERKFLIKHSETHGDEVINDGKISKKTQRVHDSLNNVAKSRVNKLLKDGLVKKNLKEEKKY